MSLRTRYRIGTASAPDSDKDNWFIGQWLTTTHPLDPAFLTLQRIVIYMMNPSLYFAGVNGMSPTSFPTVIEQDYVGIVRVDHFAEEFWSYGIKVLALGLNLYMVSQNCAAGVVMNPLFNDKAVMKAMSYAAGSRSQFHGIVFANGTVIEDPPLG